MPLGARLLRRAPVSNVSTLSDEALGDSSRAGLRLSHVRAGCAGSVAAAAVSLVVLTGLAGAAPGDLDHDFGTDGKVVVPIATYGAISQGSALQADNKIVLAGTNLQAAPPPPPPAPPARPRVEDEDFFALRLSDNGAVDSSFGTGGVVRTPIDLDPGARRRARRRNRTRRVDRRRR